MNRQYELEEQALEDSYERGEISFKELQRELNDLARSYRACAEEASQAAYDEEMGRW